MFEYFALILIKLFVSVVLAGVIGYNREKNGMTVGVRTHILVCVSATLLQMISIDFFKQTGYNGDPMRLGGQMLTGIGFLGAGSIIKENRNIRGLTTAASIFFMACIGLSVGCGFYIHAIITTFIVYLFLIDVLHIKKMISINKNFNMVIAVNMNGLYKDEISTIGDAMNSLDVEIHSFNNVTVTNDNSKVILDLRTHDEINTNDIVSTLMDIDSVSKVEILDNKNIK